MKVILSLPTDVDGKQIEQGETVEVDRATRDSLVFLGRARDADDDDDDKSTEKVN